MKQLLMSLSFLTLNSIAQSQSIKSIDWSLVTQLPVAEGHSKQMGLAGPVAGHHHNVLIVAGGSNFEDGLPWEGGKKKYFDDIYVLKKDGHSKYLWHNHTFKLPQNIAYAVSVSTPNGLLCIGGENEKGLSNNVFYIQWNDSQQNIQFVTLPSLPIPLTNATGTIVSNRFVYVAGGEIANGVAKQLMVLDIDNIEAGWRIKSQLPQEVSHAVLLNNKDQLFLVGGRKRNDNGISNLYDIVFAFNLLSNTWTTKSSLPYALSAGTGQALSPNFLLMFGGDKGTTFHQVETLLSQIQAEKNEQKKEELIQQKNQLQRQHPGFSKNVLLYNISANKWTTLNPIDETTAVTTTAIVWDDKIFIPCGEIKAGIRTANILIGKLNMTNP